MADDLHYSAKRKFDDQDDGQPPATRRATGFSAPIVSPPSAGTQPHLELAKQKAQEIAARLFNNAQATQAKAENGDNTAYSNDYTQKPTGQPIQSQYSLNTSYNSSYGSQSASKKIEIPNSKVGVIIGKGGETIKYLQAQSGAKIQVTRDADVIPFSQTRHVDIMGSSEQVNRAEQLINDVLSEADAGASGNRKAGSTQYGGEQFSMKVPSNKVGLVIGKGGETIKTMQATSGARIQVIPLHPPPGDTSLERTVQIDGTPEQIEAAKQLVNEVISGQKYMNFVLVEKNNGVKGKEHGTADVAWDSSFFTLNRMRSQSMSGGYSQQSYQQPAQPPMWGPPGASQQMQQQQPPPAAPVNYYAQQSYPQYGGYPTYPDQSGNQTAQPTGYDYYNTPQQQVNPSTAPTDTNSAYNYGAYDASAYSQQTYPYPPQDGSANTAASQGSGPAPAPPAQQVPPVTQQGYNGQQQTASAAGAASGAYAAYYGQPPSQAGYGYGAPPPPSGYAPGPAYGNAPAQSQTSYNAGYGQNTAAYSTDSAPPAAAAAPQPKDTTQS